MIVTITLTTAGADTGPFNLYSDVDGFISAFETGVSKASLLAGYTSSLVPNGTTTIRVMSASALCTNYIDIVISGECPTTTSTTTISPTTTTTTSSSTTTTTTTIPPTTTTTTTIPPTTTTTTTVIPTTTTTTLPPTTTTTTTVPPTTTTTTIPPTTTTTTTIIACTIWENNSGVSAYYDYVECNGTIWLNKEILAGGSICAQVGTVAFVSGGTLTDTGTPCV